jgi:two-component system, sensor histidine kinase and response regulator
MDGWQLASEINADKQINSTKLILLSPAGKSGEEAKMKLLHWFDAYMTKPVKKLKLYSNLLKILKDEVDLESVEEVEELEELPEESAGPAGVPASILIAEDHEVNQQLFKAILESLDHEVTVASNGLEAVERASEKNFDVIFMDVQMPEMNGYEATEQLRSKGITTPIIAATASAVKEEREKCTAVGMDDLLIKPFKKTDVVPILQKWLSKGGPPIDAGATDADDAEAAGPAAAAEEEPAAAEEEPAAATAETAEDPRIFDYEQAVETFMGKKEVVARVVKSFLEKVEGQVPVMKKALDSGDLEQLRGEAHSIKGGGLNLQVLKLGNKAKELEDASREGRQKDAEGILSELLELFDEFRNYINRFFPSL